MAARKHTKKEKRFSRRMQRKLTVVFAFVLLLLVGLLARITQINVKDGATYARQVLSQQNYDSQTIPYRRGEILDRNGIVLAKSNLVYNLILDCSAANETYNDRAIYVEPTIKALVTVFDLDEITVRDKLANEKTAASQYQIMLKDVTEEQKKQFENYKSGADEELTDEQKTERSRIRGVWFEQKYIREYPYNSLASNVLGFSNDLGDGIQGIELYYDSLLRGTDGRTYGYLNADSEFQRTTIDASHGKTLVSTLDMNIQEIVEKWIRKFDEEYGDEEKKEKGAKNIGVVVMDPNNGEILGMATNSSYNLNDPRDLTKYFTGAQIKSMDEEDYVEQLNQMWSNFCVSEGFEPGSVFKPITISSALECGAVTNDNVFECDGGEFITDTMIRCDNIYGHGEETLEYAIVNSCNDALMQVGMEMKITNFLNYQQAFNFGSMTGIDLPNESPGVIYSRDSMHEVELATNTFGQGFTCSMIQEISAFSAVINGGYYYQPHVVRQVRDVNGTVEKNVNPLVLRQPISSKSSALLRGYLTTAVRKGTGRKSQVPGYKTGGKTGTAEKIDPETGRRAGGKYLVSFIGACPMDDPKVVIYCVVDEPNVDNQADSSYPQVLFRNIATEVFPYLGLYPTEEVTADLLQYLGLTRADIVREGSRGTQRTPKTETFQAFDIDGNLYNEAFVDSRGKVVGPHGDEVKGAVVNFDGTISDAWGNIAKNADGETIYFSFDEEEETEEVIDPKADNPNIALPPEDLGGNNDATTWAGVTNEDLAQEEGKDTNIDE